MRSVSRRRAADFVRPALGAARVERMWAAVAEAERGRERGFRPALRARSWRVAALLAAAALAVALLLVVRRLPPAPDLTGLVIDTGAATQEVSLAEGSNLSLSAATRLRVISATAGEMRLRLERGSMICDIVHREGRRFLVEAAGVELEDKGTRFAVEVGSSAGHDAVSVRVERGSVEVHDAERAVLATLGPGQGWTSDRPKGFPAIDALGARAPPEEPDAPPAARDAPSPTSAPNDRRAPAPGEPILSVRPAPHGPPAPSYGPTGPERAQPPSPQALFERADAARLAGHSGDAAADFDRFRRLYPSDPRAALAAYELGRIRLGSLHDPAGAAEAFSEVLKHAAGPFHEDAEAGRVEALADLGDEEGCRLARDAFRARYPESPQTRRVTKLCGKP
jgi:TolA-binding protein